MSIFFVFRRKPPAAFFEAAQRGDAQQVKQFIKERVNLDATNASFETGLMLALTGGHLEVARLLLDAGAGKLTQALIEVQSGHHEIAEELLKRGADPNGKSRFGQPVLMCATFHMASTGDSRIVELLIDHRADIDASCALHWAAGEGDVKAVELLLSRGGRIDAMGLVKHEHDVEGGLTPLHCAVERKRLETTELLLSKGAPLDGTDSRGGTPLHRAAKKSQLKIMQLLVRKGASVNARTRCGETPLMIAVFGGTIDIVRPDVVRFLIESGADVNAKDMCGQTALMLAAGMEPPWGWDIRDGWPTPWWKQEALAGRVEALGLLVSSGALLLLKDNAGRDVLSWAVQNGATAVLSALASS